MSRVVLVTREAMPRPDPETCRIPAPARASSTSSFTERLTWTGQHLSRKCRLTSPLMHTCAYAAWLPPTAESKWLIAFISPT